MKIEAGQVAVVTGAASGIGRGVAEALVERGVNVVLADVETDALAATTASITASAAESAGIAVGVDTDVSDFDAMHRLRESVIERFGSIDLVVLNAGVNATFLPASELASEDWEWVLGVNLWGVIHGVQAFLPELVNRGRGHLVATSSMVGISNLPYISPYTMSKHAIVGLIEALAIEMDELATGVRVSVLCPGFVQTNIGTSYRNRPERLRRVEGPPPTLPTQSFPAPAPEEVLSPAQAAAFLIAGVEADKLHIVPNLGSGERVRARVQTLLDDLPD